LKNYVLENSELTCIITDKSFYENGAEKFAFIYNNDGSCFMIDKVGAYQEDIFAWDIGISETDFSWDGFEYYRNAEPLIPYISKNDPSKDTLSFKFYISDLYDNDAYTENTEFADEPPLSQH
jgi:hypothetical protein